MHTQEEREYIEKRKLKRLSHTIPEEESLYQTIHGAHTIKSAMELDAITSAYHKKQKALAEARPKPVRHEASWEMGMQNERCIEKYGCSVYHFW